MCPPVVGNRASAGPVRRRTLQRPGWSLGAGDDHLCRQSHWPLDCEIRDREAAGLPAPSKVGMKLFTLDTRLLRGALGHLAEPDERRVRAALALLMTAG